MRILGLVFVFGLGCGSRVAPPPVVVGNDAPPPSPPAAATKLCRDSGPALFLPAIELSHDLKLDVDRPGGVEPEDWKGKMTVDGVVTASMWPMNAPQVHRLPDGRSLLDDRYNANLLMLWDPKTRTLTELTRGVLVPVPGRGMLISSGDQGTAAFYDIDPAGPRLREVYRYQTVDQATTVAGVIDGAPALLLQPPAGTQPDDMPTPITLLCMSSAGASGQFAITVPAGFRAMGVDPVDGHRMLLLGNYDREKLFRSYDEPPFDAEVAVLDLVTGKLRSIGRAAGAWTQTTNMPHPVLSVGWNDGTYDQRGVWFAEDSVTLVDPKSETLRSGRRP